MSKSVKKVTKIKKSTQKEPDLLVGSTFLMSAGEDSFPIRVKILSKGKGGKVECKISSPASPEKCDECGHGRNLSVDGITGVVVCMTSGCGKDFGYDPSMKVTMKESIFKF